MVARGRSPNSGATTAHYWKRCATSGSHATKSPREPARGSRRPEHRATFSLSPRASVPGSGDAPTASGASTGTALCDQNVDTCRIKPLHRVVRTTVQINCSSFQATRGNGIPSQLYPKVSMVRRGSTVRVRQRASASPCSGVAFIFGGEPSFSVDVHAAPTSVHGALTASRSLIASSHPSRAN